LYTGAALEFFPSNVMGEPDTNARFFKESNGSLTALTAAEVFGASSRYTQGYVAFQLSAAATKPAIATDVKKASTAPSTPIEINEFTIELIPAEQTVTAGNAITAITLSADSTLRTWSFRVSGDYELGLASRDMRITGTVPASLQAGTYLLTVDAENTNGASASAQAFITVIAQEIIDSPDVSPDLSPDVSPDILVPPESGDTPGGRSDRAYHVFTLPDRVRERAAARFGGSVYQFDDDEIISDTWTLGESDLQAITELNEQVILNLPYVMPKNSGVYMLRLTLSDANAGKLLKLYGITEGGNPVNASALEEINYVFLDEDGNELDRVPENGIVYAAMNLTAGRTHRGVITSVNELDIGTIQPVELSETLLEKIADTVNISADEIRFITDNNISDPEEPTQAMREEMESQQSEVIGKLNTLTVSEDGYYIVKVTLSDDLYEQIRGVSINELKIYALYDDGTGEQVNTSFITGLLNTWELLTLTGEKMEFGAREFLMIGFLNAGTPFSVYLTKLLIALLMGGCDAGLGVAGLALTAAFFILRRKR
ncbi:MAG: hypothetical protein IJS28_11680, partial [Synergistaceae bacterium]|nr:hypothetical protein [Synergistaceae bacterium]